MAAKTVQLCAVRIGFDDYLLPMADGLKLVEIMTKAASLKRTYDGARKWQVEQTAGVAVELTLVRSKNIVDRPANSRLASTYQGAK